MIKGKEEKLVRLGETLRTLREGKGLNKRQLSVRIGIDSSKLAKIEKGKVNVTILTLWLICEGLEVSPKVLFEEEGKALDDPCE